MVFPRPVTVIVKLDRYGQGGFKLFFYQNIYKPQVTNILLTNFFGFDDYMTLHEQLNKCRNLISGREYEEAMEICDEILKHDLNNPASLGYKARCLYLLDRNTDALTLLNNALILYPDNYHYLYLKAEVLSDEEEYDLALGCIEEIFEIGVEDETLLSFIKMHYTTCLGLKEDDLIEREKYVEAWKCYKQRLNFESSNLKPLEALKRFKKYVADSTVKNKSRYYHVKISSEEAKHDLMGFLLKNGFKCGDESGLLFLIDVVDKNFTAVSADNVCDNPIISESKFLDKVNYYPRDRIMCGELYDEDGNLVYEGYTLYNAPYGFGKAYFANGTLYREGIFDIKGIVQGKEYYPSGQIRFEGKWSLTKGYGPNAPYDGNAYGENGELIYSGKFKIKRGGVGWPMIQKPKGFPHEQKERPKINYY